jgi:hypothetical protein
LQVSSFLHSRKPILLGRGHRLAGARLAKTEETPLSLCDVDVTARVQ